MAAEGAKDSEMDIEITDDCGRTLCVSRDVKGNNGDVDDAQVLGTIHLIMNGEMSRPRLMSDRHLEFRVDNPLLVAWHHGA